MQTISKDTMLAALRARVARIEGGDARFRLDAPTGSDSAGSDSACSDGAETEAHDAGGPDAAPGPDRDVPSARPLFAALPLGVAEIDRRLPGRGLQSGRLHEVVGSLEGAGTGFVVHLLRGLMARDNGASGGRIDAGGPVLWCAPEATLYAPGLACRGLDVDRLVCVVAPRREDRLWAMEEALRCPGVTAVVGELRARETVDLTASRRLQLAAGQGGALALLLRPPPPAGGRRGHGRQAGMAAKAEAEALATAGSRGGAALARADEGCGLSALGASAAVTRWHVRPLPLSPDTGPDAAPTAGPGAGPGTPGRLEADPFGDDMGRRARWRLTLLRSRAGAGHAWTVEVDHATGDFALAALLRDRSGAAADRAVA